MNLSLKPDFPRTVARFEAWWRGEVLDRPPVTLWVTSAKPCRPVESRHVTCRDRWLDAEFVVDAAIARVEATEWVGDSFPVVWPNVGPEITATLFGVELEFGAHTSWSKPVVHAAQDWEQILAREPDFTNIYWQTVERITDLAIERCEGRYVVGITDLHGNYDILAGLRDPQMLCLDVVDCPELLARVGRHVARGYVAAFQRSHRKLAAAGFGSTTWTPMYHSGPAYVPSCDFWCMVSPQVARELIWPDIEFEMGAYERSLFHLDGPQALKHLDLVLSCPRLNALQWVYGDGHGRARDWLAVYQRVRAAGKGVQVLAVDVTDALAVLEALGPRGVWLHVGQPFGSVGEAEAFLREVERRSRKA